MKKLILILILDFIFTQFVGAQMSFVRSDAGFDDYHQSSLEPSSRHKKRSKRFKKQLYLGLGIGGGLFTDFLYGPRGNLGFHLNGLYHNRPKAAIDFSFYINSFKDEYEWNSYGSTSIKKCREEYNVRIMSFQIHKLILFGKKKLRPYVGAGGGVTLEYSSVEGTEIINDNSNNNLPSETTYKCNGFDALYLTISPSVGFVADLSENIQLNFNTRFTYGWEPDFFGCDYWQLNSSLSVLFRLPKSEKSKKNKRRSLGMKNQFWMGAGAGMVIGLGGEFIAGCEGNFNMLYFHRPKGCFGLNLQIISSGYQNSFPQGAGYKYELSGEEPTELDKSDKDNFKFRFINIAIQRMFFIGNKKVKPYFGIECGLTTLTIILDDPDDVYGLNSYPHVSLFLGSKVGVIVPVAKRVNLNMNARFSQSTDHYPLLTVNFGVLFNLSK